MKKILIVNNCIHSFQFFRNLKIQTQTFIIQSFIFGIVFLFIMSSQIINRRMMDDIVQKIAKSMEIQTNIKQINIQSSYITHQAYHPLVQGFRVLDKINLLYQISSDQQSAKDQFSLECSSDQAIAYYSKLPMFCETFTNSTTHSHSNFWNHVSGYYNLLNTLLLPMLSGNEKTMYFTFISDEQYFAINPPKIVPDSYLPSERLWYTEQMDEIEHTKKNDSTVISGLYQDYETLKYEFTLTQGLTDQYGALQGIFGIDLTLQHYKELLRYKDLNIIIVNLNGQMILSNLVIQQNIDLSHEEVFIYDTTKTGFDNQDWQQMLSEAEKTGAGKTECDLQIHQFCRYNTLFKQDLIITIINMYDQFYLILFQSIEQIEADIQYAHILQEEVIYQINYFLYCSIIVALFLLLMSWIITPFFFKPFTNIQKIIKIQMIQKFTIHYEHILFSLRKKTQLSFLQSSFGAFSQKLFDFAQYKSRHCYLIENFKYPLQKSIANSLLNSFIKTQLDSEKIKNLPDKNKLSVEQVDPFCEIENQYSCKSSQFMEHSIRDVTFRIMKKELIN